ncbi:MAG TPA: non-ribosomal peptide synthetase, partial [Myxococcota bacterium]|nr:non-ribosomal peptide synthetase [Myxococcota bacterium]
LLTTQALVERLPTHWGHLLCLDSDAHLWGQLPATNPSVSAAAENLAYLIYTSGSTGRPKAVAVTHRNVARLVRASNYLRLLPGDCVAQAATVSFDASTFELWGALGNGARLRLIGRETLLAPERLGAELRRGSVSVLFLTTALFNQMARHGGGVFNGLEQLLFGGEAVEPRWVAAVRAQGYEGRLLHVYGPTEGTTFTSWQEVEEVRAGAATVGIGRGLSNTRLYVVDGSGRLAPVGVAGELWIGGEGLARGYWGRAGQTAARFVPDEFSGDVGGRLYRTGDVVRWVSGGMLEFVGRRDGQVKVRGHRVELEEIGVRLEEHERVREAVAVAQREETESQRLVAYVVSEDGEEVSSAELRSYLKEKLPEYMIPSQFVRLAELPLTPSGKVDRRALPAPEPAQGALEGEYVAPREGVEQELAAVWREVLGVEHIGAHDNYFDLGGDSIRAIQMVARAERRGLRFGIQEL